MDATIVATPLRTGAVSKPYTFSDGVTIRNIHPILWDRSVAKAFMSDEERTHLSESRFWLSVSKPAEQWGIGQSDDSLYEKARRAMNALQIIGPMGGRNVYLKFREVPEGFDNTGSLHPSKMESTMIGRLAMPEKQGLQGNFDKVFQGVNQAFDQNIVRIENPILLLEHGLQTSHVYLSTLMWVMGLDMLFMAGDAVTFANRAAGFLGGNTLVFPPLPFGFPQPRLTIGEVLRDVYELRNIIAHGRAVPAIPFREKRDLVDADNIRISEFDYRYSEIIMESALFLLSRSLRKIMVDDLVDLVKDEAAWKQKLKVGAHIEESRALT